MKWGQAAAKLEAAMKGNKKESEMNKYMVVRRVEAFTIVEAHSEQEALDIAACMATHEFDCEHYGDKIDPDYGDAVKENENA